ncbi:magnesium transporter CorA family protein [Marinilabiliaceae bacterium JC017]|nr:magnesium transporter CorA family protein [Marinilabiliaceae bacterium JC017]
MIQYLELSKGFPEIDKWQKYSWVKVQVPGASEVQILCKLFNLPKDFVYDTLDPDERARSEWSGDWSMHIIRIPLYSPSNGVPYKTISMGVFVSDDTIITICKERERISSRVLGFTDFNPLLSEPRNFFLNILLHTAQKYLIYLKRINVQAHQIEDELVEMSNNEDLHKLLKMQKCLVYFLASLKSNELLLNKLSVGRRDDVRKIDKNLLDDVVIETRQAIEMTTIYSEIQDSMMQAFSNVISNNLNNIMKQLTSITIILMIPTLIGSFYGMNTINFLEDSRYGFAGIILVSILLSLLGVFWFRKKKLF